ncbi:MAG: leucine-rich repeat domain-containing protein [Promethearchaeota archaeon]
MIYTREQWNLFLRELDHIADRGKLKFLTLSSKSNLPPLEITDWSFLLRFPNLERLSISNLALHALPSELFQLPHLKRLSIGNLQIKEIPPEIGFLTNLEEFKLSNLSITRLPPEIGLLTNLTRLNIFECPLENFDTNIFTLPKLETLSISRCRLAEIPPEIGQLYQLKTLGVSHNQITELPPEIGQLRQLKSLGVSHNQITELPPEIGQLTSLRVLAISQYPMLMKELPLTMADCIHITEIKGMYQLESIPLSLAVSWPEYESPTDLKIQLPPEMDFIPDLSRINPEYPTSELHRLNYIFYPIEQLFQDLLDGKSVTKHAFRRMSKYFTPSMKKHLLNTLPSNHSYINWLKTMDTLFLPSGYSIKL